MHIVIDARLLLPQQTGIGTYLIALARELRALSTDERFEFWLQAGLGAEHPIWQFESERVKLRQLPIRHMDIQAQWRVPRRLARCKPDLLHYPHFDLPWLVPGAVVATIYDLKYIARPDFFPYVASVKRLAMWAMMAFTVRRARRVIVISEHTRQDAIRWLKAPPHKLRIVNLGVTVEQFQNLPAGAVAAVRRRYGLDNPFLLFVSERRPHKNIPSLLRAFASFRRMVAQPYTLAIAGKAYANYQEPERETERLGLGEHVRFLDYVPDEDLPALYHAADAYVLLSLYEGFGLGPLEAMAAGTPAVAADLTSLPEVVGDAGLLVPADQPEQVAAALKQVIPGGEHREECIARGLARAQQFTWTHCVRRTLGVYREAIGP